MFEDRKPICCMAEIMLRIKYSK